MIYDIATFDNELFEKDKIWIRSKIYRSLTRKVNAPVLRNI